MNVLEKGREWKIAGERKKIIAMKEGKKRNWREKENVVTFRGERPIHINFVGMW